MDSVAVVDKRLIQTRHLLEWQLLQHGGQPICVCVCGECVCVCVCGSVSPVSCDLNVSRLQHLRTLQDETWSEGRKYPGRVSRSALHLGGHSTSLHFI